MCLYKLLKINVKMYEIFCTAPFFVNKCLKMWKIWEITNYNKKCIFIFDLKHIIDDCHLFQRHRHPTPKPSFFWTQEGTKTRLKIKKPGIQDRNRNKEGTFRPFFLVNKIFLVGLSTLQCGSTPHCTFFDMFWGFGWSKGQMILKR